MSFVRVFVIVWILASNWYQLTTVRAFWFFSCPRGSGHGLPGDACSVFCQCKSPNTCEAGVQRCSAPGKYSERCHATRPCARRLSCQPGIQKCFHSPRKLYEPCVIGHDCASGLTCEPGMQVCYHRPRQLREPCVAGFGCAAGLSCHPGTQRCLHHPRRENERCSLGFGCKDGLKCSLCAGKPYSTCQMARLPPLSDEDYKRPYNEVAFLVTHNSFSNDLKYAPWVRNQRNSIATQLQDGVRGFMLDIYPGWGGVEVRLCHASCLWGGSADLLDTLVEIRQFMDNNPKEVVTIIFEDYLKNPTILKRVFDRSGISHHVLIDEYWAGSGRYDWPSLIEMRTLGRVVVFNNNGLDGFPYSLWNMWYYVRENRYGSDSQNNEECIDREESKWGGDGSGTRNLVLVNWFGTVADPLDPCLNSFEAIKTKLSTCFHKFGRWANFLAVDFYDAGSRGGAFKAVQWVNDNWRKWKKKKTSEFWR